MAIFTKKLSSWIGTLSALTVLPLAVAKPADASSLAPGLNIVTNGSFEDIEKTVHFNQKGWDVFSSIEGWTVSAGSLYSAKNGNGITGIEVQNGVAGKALDGKNLVELDGNGNTGIFQDLKTKVGKKYKLEFAFAPRANIKENILNVNWGDKLVAKLTADGTDNEQKKWTSFSYELLATSAITRLRFDNFGSKSDTFGTYIDNVSVSKITPVPEPASILGLLAFGAFGATSLRKGKDQKVTTQA